MSQSLQIRYKWNTLPWKRIQVKVFKLQRRIYRASQRGDVKTVHFLQRLLVKSWFARLLAVRRVSQDNRGKKSAGIDGVKSLTPVQRLRLANQLHRLPKPQPLRRVWIPKPGKAEKRPLAIPVMQDRAAQALLKLALEPQWEARLEPNVYGFRPGRSCHDAIVAVFSCIYRKPKYVLEGDIQGCFENIDHAALLEKSQTPPHLRRLLRGWLTCGVMDGTVSPTERGTPQGGCISPVLALIALHGLASEITALGRSRKRIHAVFYADDFVVFAEDKADLFRARTTIERGLSAMGLTLHPHKTKISHTLTGNAGFEFLGFHIRQHRVGKYAAKSGFKTLIKPSPQKVKSHLQQLDILVHHQGSAPQAQLIDRLNLAIRGWCNYYATVTSSSCFARLSHLLFWMLLRWAVRRHPKLNRYEIVSRYWLVNQGGGWRFQTPDGKLLSSHQKTPSRRHIKVRANKSPYDGDWLYWASRRGSYPGINTLKASLLKAQRGRCEYCGLFFLPEDAIELHHRDGNHLNHRRVNLGLLHRHCHDQVHATEIVVSTGTPDKEPSLEEPCAVKVASTVLKPSRRGDSPA
jgi:RNA-directed DNA polymerase